MIKKYLSKKSKVLKIILGSSTLTIIAFGIVLIPLLMLLDFFGAEVTSDGYVEGNSYYAEEYQRVLNKYLTVKNPLGYVPLSRILYFSLEDETLSWDEIYVDNLDKDTKSLIPISEVCAENKYKDFDVCNQSEIEDSEQDNEEIMKPFTIPIDLSLSTITSYYGQERIVFGNADIHFAWDLASPSQTPVYSIGDGKVKTVSFNYSQPVTNINGGAGNYIEVEYEVNDKIYVAIYGHLYPNSSKVKVGDTVSSFQELAGVSTTGYSTGDHLHIALSQDGNRVDLFNYIDFTQTLEHNIFKPGYELPSLNR
ncbi:MAG: M23 family metallopeptidase [bacterium]|nr:M23 family metallopeptidase [bacterium]